MEDYPISSDSTISIFNISWLSETDGPGKRLVLFMQGCHLDCEWCHSPHSQPKESPILYFDSLCKKCQRCKLACENEVHSFVDGEHLVEREHCTHCGNCVEACPQSSTYKQIGAIILPTQQVKVSTLFETIKPHLELLKDVGGITFSGGEPLLQSDSLAVLAQKCKESGFHTALETSGIIPIHQLEKVYPYIDTWLVGMRLTTGSNSLQADYLEKMTRQTLQRLSQKPNADILIRIPVIPDYTTTDWYLKTVRQILLDYQLTKVEVLPQNPEGSHYYNAAGLPPLAEYNKVHSDEMYKCVSEYFSMK